jgi:hypothetical protein
MALSLASLVTVAEAGAHLRLDSSTIMTDTTLLEGLIDAATREVEDYTGRVFITKTITETRIGDGEVTLRLWKRPVTDITSVSLAGVALAGTDWIERLSIGRIYYNSGWTIDEEVVVVYTAGYGAREAAQAACPEAVLAVKMLVASMYEDREGVKSQSISGIGSMEKDPDAWKKKVQSLKVSVI